MDFDTAEPAELREGRQMTVGKHVLQPSTSSTKLSWMNLPLIVKSGNS